MKHEVADDWRGDEAREGENVRNRIDVLMRGKLSEDLKKGFPGPSGLWSGKVIGCLAMLHVTNARFSVFGGSEAGEPTD